MPPFKLSAFFSVLMVFVSGVAVGGISYRLYTAKVVAAPPAPAKKSPEEFRKWLIGKMKDSIKLDDSQIVQLNKIYDETQESYIQTREKAHAIIEPARKQADMENDATHNAQVAKIKALLTPSQLPLYEKWEADREARREADRKKRQLEHPDHKDGKGPGRPPGSQLP